MRLTYNLFIYYLSMGNSLVVQWLRFHAFIAGGTSSIPGWGTKIPHAAWCGQKKKKQTISDFLCNIFFFPFWSYPRNNGPTPKMYFGTKYMSFKRGNPNQLFSYPKL